MVAIQRVFKAMVVLGGWFLIGAFVLMVLAVFVGGG